MKWATVPVLIAAALAANTALARSDGEFIAAFAAEGTTLDPTKYSAGVDHYFISQMFEQLVRPDPSLKDVNWLAESWTVETVDGKPVIDIRIREGVKFHNGEDLTAEDFEYAYQRQKNPEISRWSHMQAAVERFEIVDPHHFRIHFKEGDGNYVAGYLQLWAIPKDYIEKVGDEGFAKHPVGTGPWKFVSRKVKEEIRFEAFDSYWNKEHRPKAQYLTIKVIPENTTRLAAFKTGEVDWIDGVPLSSIDEVRNMPGVKTAQLVSGNNLFFDFASDQEGSPFADVRVRKAVAHAIDVDSIIKHVLFGQGQRYAQIGEGTTGYDPALKPYPYDPAKARKLLAEAGYPNGFDTPCYNLNTPREPNIKEMGEAAYAYLRAVGIRCKIEGMEYGAWINLGRRGTGKEVDGIISWMWSQGLPGDPATPWAGHLHSYEPGKGWGSYSHTSDAKADAMVEELKKTMDPAQRVELIRKIARYKHENVLGGLTTYRPVITVAWRDNVEWTPWPYPGYWRGFQEVELKN